MLIGVLSDSHDNIENVVRAARLFREKGVGLVLHLGDIVAPFTLARLVAELGGIKVRAVFGNNCGEKPLLLRVAENLGADISDPPRVLEIEGRRLLLTHGYGDVETTIEIVEALAASGKWDGVLYGHTHKADYRYLQGRLLLNPGEVAGVLEEPTVAVVDTGTLKAKIYKVRGV